MDFNYVIGTVTFDEISLVHTVFVVICYWIFAVIKWDWPLGHLLIASKDWVIYILHKTGPFKISFLFVVVVILDSMDLHFGLCSLTKELGFLLSILNYQKLH